MIIKELISSICSLLLASGPLCPWEAHRGDLCCVLSLAVICDPMDCSLPGCSLHGILQARVLERVAIHFSMGSSQPRDGTLNMPVSESLPFNGKHLW